MSNPLNCAPCCETPENVSVPGLAGQGSFSFTTSGFTVPALGGSIGVEVINTDWMSVGQTLFIEGAGLFTVTAIINSTSATLQYTNVAANTASGNVIASGTQVSPGGTPGADGTNGVNPYTVTTAGFTIPAVGANVSVPDGFVHVANTSWMAVGQIVFISDGIDFGSFRVASISSSTAFVATFMGFTGEAAPGAVIGTGATVTPGGNQQALAVALPTAITDNSTGTASNTIAAGVGVTTISIPIQLAAMTTAAADLVTNYTPGYAFKILSISFAVTTLGTGAAASQILNMEIGTTNLTGGVLTLLLADTTPLGKVTAATAITAANVGTAADTISLEVAAGGTVFTAGAGVLLIRLQNMDTANAFATLSDHVDDLIISLT